MSTPQLVMRSRRLKMPMELWPEADRLAWQAAFAPAPLLDQRRKGGEFAPRTRRTMETAYARWLSWLSTSDPAVLTLSPWKRVVEARVIAYAHALVDEIAFRTILSYVGQLRALMELMAPDGDWTWFRPIIRRIQKRARQQATVQHPFVASDQLYGFGVELMSRAAADPPLGDNARAEIFRDGLAIAFLAARPLRRTNFIELGLARHITKTTDNYRIVIPAEQTKTKAEIEFLLPDALVPYMRRYLELYRILLLQASKSRDHAPELDTSALWIGRNGAPLPSDTFADMISRRTFGRFGQRLTPHDFRHAAATTIAEKTPEEALIIRLILGHTTIATSEKYYTHATRIDAAKRYQRCVESLRTPARQQNAGRAMPADDLTRDGGDGDDSP